MTAARLTHSDLAERLNLPLSTVVELRKREGWPHVRLGKAVRFTEAQVEQIVTSHIVTSAPEAAPMFPGHRPHRPKR
ncbi:helix-turn-helix domain-containing protein [Nocardioides sp. Bht2]|uniref:helix-turn-helix domain-containing protein n=1 Tax=Nocardioides sp. Bht2 TaxID=3392297 RepID=UPI0039B55E8A